MKFVFGLFIALWICALCNGDSPTPPPQPFIGDWNFTNAPHQTSDKLCMKLRAGIRLDITYETHNGTKTAAIFADNHVVVDDGKSDCENSSSDGNETMALKFKDRDTLLLYFTRDPRITHDDKGVRWQLYKVEFQFVYDDATFPDAMRKGETDEVSNTNSTLSGIATASDRSFSCLTTGAIEVDKRFKLSFTKLQAQPFLTRDDFSPADHCATDQESTDLIPIIIGAALAALVIIVLIAYLIGRARANTPSYDNMK